MTTSTIISYPKYYTVRYTTTDMFGTVKGQFEFGRFKTENKAKEYLAANA